MIYSAPGSEFEATTDATTGLTGTIGVRILDTPGNNIVTARTTAGISEAPAGSGIYSVTLTAPDDEGTYSVVWDTGGLTPVFSHEELTVTFDSPVPVAPTAMLITVDEYKLAAGLDLSDTSQDDQITQAIEFATQAILNYTDRDFGSDPVTETRSYHYDGSSGVVEIDDASEVTAVSTSDFPLSADGWFPAPFNGPVYWWIELPRGRASSPEMGFRRNEDTFPLSSRLPIRVDVTATWGYDTVPGDVKQACIWTAAAFLSEPRPYVTSESIEGYSVAFAIPGASEALPQRAQQLLGQYERIAL